MCVLRFTSGRHCPVHERSRRKFAGTGFEVHGTEGSLIARDVMTQQPVGDGRCCAPPTARRSCRFDRDELYDARAAPFHAAMRGEGQPVGDRRGRRLVAGDGLAVRDAVGAAGQAVAIDPRLGADDTRASVVSAAEAAALIPDGCIVTVSLVERARLPGRGAGRDRRALRRRRAIRAT